MTDEEENEVAGDEDHRSHARSQLVHDLASPRLLLVVKKQVVIVSVSDSLRSHDKVYYKIYRNPNEVAAHRINEKFVEVKTCVDGKEMAFGFCQCLFIRHCVPSEIPHDNDGKDM